MESEEEEEEEEETPYSLSKEALFNIMTGELIQNPILQVLEVGKMNGIQCDLKVSDGLYWYDAVAFDTVFNVDDQNQDVDEYCIVRLSKYTVDITRKQVILIGECEVRTLMCSELTVLSPGREILHKIGMPTYLFYSVLYRDFLEPHRYFNLSATSDARKHAQQYKLCEGALRIMMTHQRPKNSPVMQILRKTNLSIDRDNIQRCNLLLSDGMHYHDAVLLSSRLKSEAFNSSLKSYAIIRMTSYVVTTSLLSDRREIALFDLEMVAEAEEVEQLVGYPQPLPFNTGTREYFQSGMPTLRPPFNQGDAATESSDTGTSPVSPRADFRLATRRKRTTGRSPAPQRPRGAAAASRQSRGAAETPRRPRGAATASRRPRGAAAASGRPRRTAAASGRPRRTAATPRRPRGAAAASGRPRRAAAAPDDPDGQRQHRDDSGEQRQHLDDSEEQRLHRDDSGEQRQHLDDSEEQRQHRDDSEEQRQHRDDSGEQRQHLDDPEGQWRYPDDPEG